MTLSNRQINPWVSSLPSPEVVPQYRGDWVAVNYELADVVRRGTTLWISHAATTANDVPGSSDKWKVLLGGGEGATLNVAENGLEALKFVDIVFTINPDTGLYNAPPVELEDGIINVVYAGVYYHPSENPEGGNL